MTDPVSFSRFFSGAAGCSFSRPALGTAEADRLRRLCVLQGIPACGQDEFFDRLLHLSLEADVPAVSLLSPTRPARCDGLLFPTLDAAVLTEAAAPLPSARPLRGDVKVLCPLCWMDESALSDRLEEIGAFERALFAAAVGQSHLLAAVRELSDSLLSLILPLCPADRIGKRARGIIGRELPGRGSKQQGQIFVRYFDAFTPEGPRRIFPSAEVCDRVYILEDHYGLASLFLSPIERAAADAGLTVLRGPAPDRSGNRAAHLLMPELSLAFFSANKAHLFPGHPYRHIRLDAMLDRDLLRARHASLAGLRKNICSLEGEAAAAAAAQAKAETSLSRLFSSFINPSRLETEALSLFGWLAS